MAIQLCDSGHQAIAFVGDCPLCAARIRSEVHGPRPLREGLTLYATDLDKALRAHYDPADPPTAPAAKPSPLELNVDPVMRAEIRATQALMRALSEQP